MPGSDDIIATTSDCGDVFLFSRAAQRRRLGLSASTANGGSREQQQGRQWRGMGAAASTGDEPMHDAEAEAGASGEDEGAGEEQEVSDDGLEGSAEGFNPDCVLEGRSGGGFGLCWDPGPGGRTLLAAGSGASGCSGGGAVRGGVVCVWDTGRAAEGAARLAPLATLPSGHAAASGANDVTCGPDGGGAFATAGDDGAVRLHDWRQGGSGGGGSGGGGSALLFQCSRGEALDCLQWEPRPGSHLIAAGGGEGALYVVDTRRPGHALLARRQHAGAVAQVEWAASLSLCEGLAWNPERPWMVASLGRAPMEVPIEDGSDGDGGGDRDGGGGGKSKLTEAPVLQLWEPLALSVGLGKVR
ncbi:hypothetical protein MNEG_5627 [Monoraphidium neglectum]|uniref:Uncharacterized protein n=1 Tax=Monoraphidium neglectum TaxID=145388 RepID=A0A0D2N9K6_9CHLO|nr:hypothetical protein MNEG_5627 [Monoraphidium neglectum]KIZ02331.1 hypothetical protein MNEG_5627 [Monoraphidium neglectum]|eukprot:XP_013901350.1 hypothetical protein MNEG_5627 [Monoraphidium neglectum]